MPIPNPSCAVAFPRDLKNATDAEHATGNATASAPNASKPASLQELRAQLRAQLTRNQGAQPEIEKDAELRPELRVQESTTTTSCTVAFPIGRNRATEDHAELVALVNLIADHNAFSPEDRAEALQIALADSISALECFRSLAAQIPGRTAERPA